MAKAVPNTYPYATLTRDVRNLGGIWQLVFDFAQEGDKRWLTDKIPPEAIHVGVPGGFNDQFTERNIRDFARTVYYYLWVSIPDDGRRNFLRFDSVNYSARVFLDGDLLGEHTGAHLPFCLEVPEVHHGKNCLLIVTANTQLSGNSIPPGDPLTFTKHEHGVDLVRQKIHFDFFHYGGILRDVWLVRTEKTFVTRLALNTASLAHDHRKACIKYRVYTSEPAYKLTLTIVAPDGSVTLSETEISECGEITVYNPCVWQPGIGGVNETTVRVYNQSGEMVDQMRDFFGIRTVALKDYRIHVNGKPIYLRGFGRHEDFPVMGKYMPAALQVKDYQLMRWVGANSFRTSHYPYSEQDLLLADKQGWLVIGETPGVGCGAGYDGKLWRDHEDQAEEAYYDDLIAAGVELHAQIIQEMIERDGNRACIVMWSLANEAASGFSKAHEYFANLVNRTRELDSERLLMLVVYSQAYYEKAAGLFDVIGMNRYHGWYEESGVPEAAGKILSTALTEMHEKFRKPILLSEFGADAVAGLHALPGSMFSEEYQVEVLEACFRAVENCNFLIGEHVWTFADFSTSEGVKRVVGNRKGVFTRDRQPKAAAWFLRSHWHAAEKIKDRQAECL